MNASRNINHNTASSLQIHRTEMIAYISQHLSSINIIIIIIIIGKKNNVQFSANVSALQQT